MDLTTKRSRSKVIAFSKQLESFYEKTFPKPADDAFWTEVDRLDAELAKQLAVRPLTAMETDRALKKFTQGFQVAAAEAKARAS